MLEARQNLALLKEAAAQLRTVDVLLCNLQRDVLLELSVRPLGEVDDAHSAFAQQPEKPEGSDHLPAALDRGGTPPIDLQHEPGRAIEGRMRQQTRRIAFGREQLLDLT